MKKKLFYYIRFHLVLFCLLLIGTGILFTGCNKSGSRVDPAPDPPDTAAKCVSLSCIYPNILAQPGTVLYAYDYSNVKLIRLQTSHYLSLKAKDNYSEFEIRVSGDTLKTDTSYQNPYVTFQTKYDNAKSSLAPFTMNIDSIHGNRFSGSFAGSLFDSQLWRPVTLSGHFVNVILQ